MTILLETIRKVLDEYKKKDSYVTSSFSVNDRERTSTITIDFTGIARTNAELNVKLKWEENTLVVKQFELYGNDPDDTSVSDEYLYQEGITIILEIARETDAGKLYFNDITAGGVEEVLEKFGFLISNEIFRLYVLLLEEANYFESQSIMLEFSTFWNSIKEKYESLILNFSKTKPSVEFYYNGTDGELAVSLKENIIQLTDRETDKYLSIPKDFNLEFIQLIEEFIEEIASTNTVELLINPPRKYFDKFLTNIGYSMRVRDRVFESLRYHISAIELETKLMKDWKYKKSASQFNLSVLNLDRFWFVILDMGELEVYLFHNEKEATERYQEVFIKMMADEAKKYMNGFIHSEKTTTAEKVSEELPY